MFILADKRGGSSYTAIESDDLQCHHFETKLFLEFYCVSNLYIRIFHISR